MTSDDTELDFIRRYTSDVACLLRKLEPGPIVAAVTALYTAWETGKPVLFCGNGGSGASCSHIVNDFQKCVGQETGRPLKALCLSDCAPLVSAWANDSEWANVFAPQVATWGEPGGVLVAVSGSGNSANVLNAVREACSMRIEVVGLTGFSGGLLKQMADISLHVPTESMQQAEDVHMVLLHMLFIGLVRRIKQESAVVSVAESATTTVKQTFEYASGAHGPDLCSDPPAASEYDAEWYRIRVDEQIRQNRIKRDTTREIGLKSRIGGGETL